MANNRQQDKFKRLTVRKKKKKENICPTRSIKLYTTNNISQQKFK